MRISVRIALALGLVVGSALPAGAAVFDTETKYCGAFEQVRIRSDSTGSTEHLVLYPSRTTGFWNNGSTWRIRYSNTDREDTTWMVWVENGAISDPGTYGYCYPDIE